MSSKLLSKARSYGTKAIDERLFVRSRTLVARSRMDISSPLPILNTSPAARGSLMSADIAQTTSPTHVKLRV